MHKGSRMPTAATGTRRRSFTCRAVYPLLLCIGYGLGSGLQRWSPGVTQPARALPAPAVVDFAVAAPAPTANSAMVKSAPIATADSLLPIAAAALDSTDPAVRLEAAHVLGERGDPISLAVLEQVLYDPERRVRAAAMDALSMRPTPGIIDTLARTMSHPDPRVRNLAHELREELLSPGHFQQQ
jgi:HEAT repeats